MRTLLPLAVLTALLLPTVAMAGAKLATPPLRSWVFLGKGNVVSARIPKNHDAPATLSCRAGETVLKAEMLAQGTHSQISLVLDQRVYQLESVQAKTKGRGIYAMTGQLALTPKLLRDLETTHSKAGFLLDGKAFRYGRPVDALAALADRCTVLMGE